MGHSVNKTKIYLAQMQPVLGDKEKNTGKIFSFIKEAAQSNADLVLFPELALTGLSTKSRTNELAESISGPSVKKVQKWAREHNIKVIFGFPEAVNGNVYNSACFINHKGDIIGTHKKVHLWDEEAKYYSGGDSFKVWDTKIGKIGIMICYDTQFSESARILAVKGAQMILIPTGNMSPFEFHQSFHIRCRAEENQLFVATTNLVGQEGSLHFFGESTAADPFGEILVKADQSEMGVMVEFDLNKIHEARSNYNYLANRRPEVYKDLTLTRYMHDPFNE